MSCPYCRCELVQTDSGADSPAHAQTPRHPDAVERLERISVAQQMDGLRIAISRLWRTDEARGDLINDLVAPLIAAFALFLVALGNSEHENDYGDSEDENDYNDV